jgi:hypothetical protein
MPSGLGFDSGAIFDGAALADVATRMDWHLCLSAGVIAQLTAANERTIPDHAHFAYNHASAAASEVSSKKISANPDAAIISDV